MRLKYTHNGIEYDKDRETGAVLYPVRITGRNARPGHMANVLIDPDQIARVAKYVWVFRTGVKSGSVIRNVGTKIKGRTILHYIATGDDGIVPKKAFPINGNPLDARRENIGVEWPDEEDAVSRSKAVSRLRVAQDVQSPIDPDIPLLPSPVKIRAQRQRVGGISESLRSKILDRDGGICFYCEFEADQVDHIIPYSYGGTDDEANLIACCGICNGIASDKVFNTLSEKREYVRSRYGPYMERRYRRFLQKHSVCASCQNLYNPQDALASMVLCPKCYQAELREDAS